MTLLAIELIAIRTSQEGVPEVLLNTLSLVYKIQIFSKYISLLIINKIIDIQYGYYISL
jgi:hypothetical protein